MTVYTILPRSVAELHSSIAFLQFLVLLLVLSADTANRTA